MAFDVCFIAPSANATFQARPAAAPAAPVSHDTPVIQQVPHQIPTHNSSIVHQKNKQLPFIQRQSYLACPIHKPEHPHTTETNIHAATHATPHVADPPPFLQGVPLTSPRNNQRNVHNRHRALADLRARLAAARGALRPLTRPALVRALPARRRQPPWGALDSVRTLGAASRLFALRGRRRVRHALREDAECQDRVWEQARAWVSGWGRRRWARGVDARSFLQMVLLWGSEGGGRPRGIMVWWGSRTCPALCPSFSPPFLFSVASCAHVTGSRLLALCPPSVSPA